VVEVLILLHCELWIGEGNEAFGARVKLEVKKDMQLGAVGVMSVELLSTTKLLL
jgi:hypothetical protein